MTYDPNNVFARILAKEIPASLVHEDEHCVAFRDVSPQAPEHVLVIPKRPIEKLDAARSVDKELLGHLLLTAAEIARELGVAEGYRIVINNGEGGGQAVFHLHVHLLAGRSFAWPPG